MNGHIPQNSRPLFSKQDADLLIEGSHYNPHRCLGLHHLAEQKVIRLFFPGARELFLEYRGSIVAAPLVHEEGLFALLVDGDATWRDYRIYHASGMLGYDPYSFPPTFGEMDAYLFSQGTHYQLYKSLGGRLAEVNGVAGAKFAVWAPEAKRVSLVADFNHFDGRKNPMRTLGACGVWEIFVPGLQAGEKYKFEIKTASCDIHVKADPMAYYSQLRPDTASILSDVDSYSWCDNDFLQKRAKTRLDQPITIYEVHLGSWRLQNGCFYNYRQLAHELADYSLEMGFTHVEIMPVAEHPLDESWGYQVTGYYSVTSRYGTVEDFQYFVDYLHQRGIGVILDWVPGHFPADSFALARFDGSCLYEHADPRLGVHPHWNTLIFNYGRKEVSNFLIANALFWLEVMHVDGLRVDAVASMLYLDYGRVDGEWLPNQYGGKENLQAIEFLKHVNSIVHKRCQGILMIAEESTSFAHITRPVESGGLGFDLKWNMGWMNDTLNYFSKDNIFRAYHQNQLTFSLLYAFSEQFLLVLSHDEVVHGKKSLLSKMPGDRWQQFAGLRLLYSYMLCHPGKNLLFMGGELGQWGEWYCKASIDWNLLAYKEHAALQHFVREMNHFYLSNTSLWQRDFDWSGFQWISFNDSQNSVLVYRRIADDQELVCLHHFTPTTIERYIVYLENAKEVREVMNSDSVKYGGGGKENALIPVVHDDAFRSIGFSITLAPLATQVFLVSYV